MALDAFANLCVLIGAAAGFGYGVVVFFASKSPLYARMITGAVGCAMLSRLSDVVRALAGFVDIYGFQLSMLSTVGVFLFLLTANAGLMDGLADDGTKKFSKYRLMALAAPCAILLLNIPIFLSDALQVTKIASLVVSLIIAAASYFNLKHAIFPDVEFGVIHCVRNYNLCALAYAFLHMAELVVIACGFTPALIVLGLLLAVDSALILPVLKKGIQQWQI